MKTLVVYYSRTGTTRKLAHELAEALGADIEELKERASREGAGGYLAASRDSMRRRPADLLPLTYAPTDYDMVVIGGPCWTQTMCTPTRTYVMQQKENLGNVGFFSTAGGLMFVRPKGDSLHEDRHGADAGRDDGTGAEGSRGRALTGTCGIRRRVAGRSSTGIAEGRESCEHWSSTTRGRATIEGLPANWQRRWTRTSKN